MQDISMPLLDMNLIMNRTILVVDDDKDILDATQFTLEYAGYSVETAEKGEIVERLPKKKEMPDLIILDMLLSGKDGRVLCKNLKSNDETKDIPVIMMSAHPDAAVSVKRVGADAFLAKPFDVDRLLKTVEEYVPCESN